jgi:hypothetical protein
MWTRRSSPKSPEKPRCPSWWTFGRHGAAPVVQLLRKSMSLHARWSGEVWSSRSTRTNTRRSPLSSGFNQFRILCSSAGELSSRSGRALFREWKCGDGSRRRPEGCSRGNNCRLDWYGARLSATSKSNSNFWSTWDVLGVYQGPASRRADESRDQMAFRHWSLAWVVYNTTHAWGVTSPWFRRSHRNKREEAGLPGHRLRALPRSAV